MLLTAHDISMRASHTNAQRTLDRLRALHAVAIVNENDTVATNEIRFGDNDRLSALVAHLVGAEALVLLSDIDGLYDSDPRKAPGAKFISEVGGPADLDGVVAGRGSELGTGGMVSKVPSALLAADAGVPVLLAAAADAASALSDASVGTVFAARPERMSARRFWVRYAAESAGSLTLDEGAVRAVVGQRRSLLAAGITAVSGRFYGGDVVELRGPDTTMVARGVVAYDAAELATMIGRSTSELPDELRRPAVHADDLVAVVSLAERAAVVLPGGRFGARSVAAGVVLVHLGLFFPFSDIDQVLVQPMLRQPVSTPDLVQRKRHQQRPGIERHRHLGVHVQRSGQQPERCENQQRRYRPPQHVPAHGSLARQIVCDPAAHRVG